MRSWRKLGLLGSLYLSQGLPFGFFVQALPVLLRQMGLSLPAIGAANLLALPWLLKFLWAPLIDRTPVGALGLGRRKVWILALQGSAALAMAAFAFVDPRLALGALALATALSNLLAATQDVAADGLAVELLSPEERGAGNGVQVAAYRVGMIVGGGALLIVFEHAGWTPTLLAMAALLALATLPIALHREAPTAPPPQGHALADLWAALARPGLLPWLGLLCAFKLGEALAGGMIRPLLVDLGYDLSDIGWLLGGGGFTAGLLGALVGGWGAQRLGRARAALGFGALQSLAVAAWVAPALGLGGGPGVIAATLLEHFASGTATVAVFTVMMDVCRRDEGQAGTDYTLQACAFVAAQLGGGALSGLLAARLGYPVHFALAAGISLVGALALGLGVPGALRRLDPNLAALGQRGKAGHA